MTITALIDADLIAYRCAATCETEGDPGIATWRCNDLIERIIDAVGASSSTLYLSGSTNFRKEVDPEYKAHRKDKPKPKWLNQCREFMVKEWQAKVTDGIEADDALAIAQTEASYICSLDKDMLQVPGMHYNWVKNEEYYITPEEGLYNFWTQTIVGDVADNITGIRGLGPVKTKAILEPIRDKEEDFSNEALNRLYYNCVAELYNDPERLHRNCKLLYLLRFEGDSWLTPDELDARTTESIEVSLKKTSRKSLKPKGSKLPTNQIESSTNSPVAYEVTAPTGE